MNAEGRSSVTALPLSPAEKRFRFRRYLPFIVFMGFVGWVLLAGILSAILKDLLPGEAGRMLGLLIAAVALLATGVASFARSGHQFAGCKLEVTEDQLIIQAPTGSGILERRFPITSIEEFILGRHANAWERFDRDYLWMLAPVVLVTNSIRESARAGVLTVRTAEESAIFQSINKIFDLASINAVVNELARRGVRIHRITTDSDN